MLVRKKSTFSDTKTFSLPFFSGLGYIFAGLGYIFAGLGYIFAFHYQASTFTPTYLHHTHNGLAHLFTLHIIHAS